MYRGVKGDTENEDNTWHCWFHTMFPDYWPSFSYIAFSLSLLNDKRKWILMFDSCSSSVKGLSDFAWALWRWYMKIRWACMCIWWYCNDVCLVLAWIIFLCSYPKTVIISSYFCRGYMHQLFNIYIFLLNYMHIYFNYE